MKKISDGSFVILFFRGDNLWFFRWRMEQERVVPLQYDVVESLRRAFGSLFKELEGVSITFEIPESVARFVTLE